MGQTELKAPVGQLLKMQMRILNIWWGIILCFVCPFAHAEIGTLVMNPAADMERADVSYLKPPGNPKAVLVLCPGANGDGRGMIQEREWQDFANREHLGLMGIHFQSPGDLLSMCQGYYQASNGSGEVLLKSIRRIYGRDLSILIYGFSGGAHFTTRFVAWSPERILGWCALGAGVLDQPMPARNNPPGIMACGENDTRLGGALVFFKQGRAVQKPWLWIEVPKTGHATSTNLDIFIRAYFKSLLHYPSGTGAWVDIDLMKEISREEAQRTPSLSGWLPERELFKSWEQFRDN